MKKLSILLLCLLLLLPAVSLGEAGTRIVEFDDFTLTVSESDLLLTGEDAGIENLFKVFPHHDAEAAAHPNIIARWTEQDLSGMNDTEAIDFCYGDMQAAIQSLTAQNLTVSNEQMLRAELDEETGAITVLYSLDVDTAALGQDMTMTVYMGCRYVPLGEKGTYYFTLGCSSAEEAKALLAYLDNSLVIRK
ncbi:MAG: hypothetical protein IJA77_11495 [Clostridia bacterium]|nr:hypothetical protein [Clostridia bacterium]